MSDLLLDLALLNTLHQDLDAVAAEFKGADEFSDAVAAATGHDGLATHVRSFASNWNIKRGDMTDDIEKLSGQIGAIVDGFTKTDQGLAKALETPATAPAAATPAATAPANGAAK